jgi:hypothetical protein
MHASEWEVPLTRRAQTSPRERGEVKGAMP